MFFKLLAPLIVPLIEFVVDKVQDAIEKKKRKKLAGLIVDARAAALIREREEGLRHRTE